MKKYSQFKATMAIFTASLKSSFREPSTLVFGLLFPIIFILVFGFIGGRGEKIQTAITKNTDTDNIIYQTLEKIDALSIQKDLSEEQIQEQLEKGTIDGVLSVQNMQLEKEGDSGKYVVKSYQVAVTTSSASPQNGQLLKSVVGGVVDKINLEVLASQGQKGVIDYQASEIQGRAFKVIDFILPGQLGFSLLSIGVFSTAFVFLSLRQTLVLKRFFVTPIKKANIVIGECMSKLVFAMMQATIILSVGYFFFGFTLVHGLLTFFSMLFLAIIGLVVFMGFGFIVSSLAKSENAVPPIANLVTLPQFLLAGTFFAIEAFPTWLQPISRIMPLTYLNIAMRKVAFEGVNVFTLYKEIGILLLWGIVVYVIAIKKFRWE